jgi:ferritin
MNPPRVTSPRKSRFAESLLKARSEGKSPSIVSLYGVHRVTIKPSDEMKEMFEKTQATLEEINKSLKKLANSDKSTSQIVQEVLSQPLGEPGTTEEIDEPAELSGVNTEALSTFEEEVEEGVC